MGNKVSLENEMINLRIVSKQMQRSSKKCEKNEKAALEKLKKVGIAWGSCSSVFRRVWIAFYLSYTVSYSMIFMTLSLSIIRLGHSTRKP